MRDTSPENVAQLWADRDVTAAGVWLNSLEAGSSRDAAVATYAGKIASAFPELAQRWVETIKDEALRLRLKEAVANR